MATPRPMRATRDCTIGETSVTVVSPQTTRNVVMIETTAIAIGTMARNEPNTKARTSRAPKPPSSASTSTPAERPREGPAGPAGPAALVRQRVEAAEAHGRAGDRRASQRGARPLLGL